MNNEKVLLGMSGGVDSSMSAWYLLQQGYKVIGVTFNTVSPISSNKSLQFITEAKDMALKLGIEHHIIDVYDKFKTEVVDYFVNEYLTGRTPNPCIRCNETIKWKLLFELSQELGCSKIATGHYVTVVNSNGYYHIKKGIDPNKDQSYFLWNLSQDILEKCIFPLGELLKKQVKEKALELGYDKVSYKKESMGVCFLNGKDYRDFINELKPHLKKDLAQGNIFNENGEKIGTHDGFPYYTIGQKRGLNLTKNHGECVAQIDAKNNRLITARKDELYSSHLVIKNFLIFNPNYLNQSRKVKIRIRGLDAVPPTDGELFIVNNKLHVNFSEPVWALTPGQSIVFYEMDMVVGGGIVDQIQLDIK